MTTVLVCVKRVPDVGGEVMLSADAQSVDARHVGFTLSAHESCAVELAVQTASGDEATVLTLGPAEAVEQLRSALGVGCTAAALVEADTSRFGPADVAREIAAVVRAHEETGRTHDLILLGNDAADTGDFQVGIRLAYELARPVVNGVKTVSVADGVVTARGDGPDGGVETFQVPLPAVVTVLEGGVEPRYPTITGRMKAKKVAVEKLEPRREPGGPSRVRLTLPPAQPSTVEVLGEGAAAAPAVVELFRSLGGGAVILVLVETDASGVSEVSREALTFARDLGEVHAVVVGELPSGVADALGAHGVTQVHHAVGEAFAAYGGASWAAAVVEVQQATGAEMVTASGTPRGNEVLAHVAARLGVGMAANVVASPEPFVVSRQVVGGAVLEEMRLGDRPAVFSVAGHAVESSTVASPVTPPVQSFTPEVAAADLVTRVVSTQPGEPDRSGSLRSARVVVGAGRGAGGTDGFDGVIELAQLLDGVLGVSRVVTSLGWRPHHEQVGQTGSRISPELYVPCGISGAIQHWAGCASSKTIVAINTDPDAPMMTRATYAVIGDMHEVVPAINEEVRRRRG